MVRRDLPPALHSRLRVTRKSVRLDVSRCTIDLIRLREMAKACAARDGLLSKDLMAQAAAMLEEMDGEFLQGWEQIEQEANGGRGASAKYVRSLRELAETARVDIMGALAANHLARQEPRLAIPLLERAWSGSRSARTWLGSSERPTSRPASTPGRRNYRRNMPSTRTSE